MVGLQRHYQQKYITLLERVRKGEIGTIRAGQVYWNDAGVWVRKRQAGQTELEYQMRNWYYFNWLCGDHILEQHIHNIDVANWFIGEYPKEAQGMGDARYAMVWITAKFSITTLWNSPIPVGL